MIFSEMNSNMHPIGIDFLVTYGARHMLPFWVSFHNLCWLVDQAHRLVVDKLVVGWEVIEATMTTSVPENPIVVSVQVLLVLVPRFECGRAKRALAFTVKWTLF